MTLRRPGIAWNARGPDPTGGPCHPWSVKCDLTLICVKAFACLALRKHEVDRLLPTWTNGHMVGVRDLPWSFTNMLVPWLEQWNQDIQFLTRVKPSIQVIYTFRYTNGKKPASPPCQYEGIAKIPQTHGVGSFIDLISNRRC